MGSGPSSRTRAVAPGLKWLCEIRKLQRLIRVFAGTPEIGNCALVLERVELERRPHLPCPSGWICGPRRIMTTTSQNEAARELVFKLYAPAMHWSRARPVRQCWLVGMFCPA